MGMQHVPHYPIRIWVLGEKPLFTPKKGEILTQKWTFLRNSSIENVYFLHTVKTSLDTHYMWFLTKSEWFGGFQAKNKSLQKKYGRFWRWRGGKSQKNYQTFFVRNEICQGENEIRIAKFSKMAALEQKPPISGGRPSLVKKGYEDEVPDPSLPPGKVAGMTRASF